MFLRQRFYGSEHHCPDEVGKVGLVEHLLEVGENDPFGFVEFDGDQFCALAVEVVETVVIDDFSHDLIIDSICMFCPLRPDSIRAQPARAVLSSITPELFRHSPPG